METWTFFLRTVCLQQVSDMLEVSIEAFIEDIDYMITCPKHEIKWEYSKKVQPTGPSLRKKVYENQNFINLNKFKYCHREELYLLSLLVCRLPRRNGYS